MKFYDCSTAPSPRLVRIFIAEKGVEIPVEQVDLRHGEHLSPRFRAINPHCTVPVLETDDGTRLTSSQGCWRYLEERFPDPPLLGATATGKALVADHLWRLDVDGWQALTEGFRNTAPGLANRALTGPHDYAQIAALGERGRVRSQRFLAGLDELLADRAHIAGDGFSAADISAMVLVDFARWMKLELPEGAANARRWYDAVSARPSAAA